MVERYDEKGAIESLSCGILWHNNDSNFKESRVNTPRLTCVEGKCLGHELN